MAVFPCTQGATWRLGIFAASSLAICVAGQVSIAAVLLVDAKAMEGGFSVLGLVRFISIVVATVGVVTYIYVSARSPRPAQLHEHGAVLVLMLPGLVTGMAAEVAENRGMMVAKWVLSGTSYGMWGVHKVIFLLLLTEKLSVLGPPPSRFLGIRLWGRSLVAFALAMCYGAVAGWSLIWILHLAGFSVEDLNATSAFTSAVGDLSALELNLFRTCVAVSTIGATGYFVVGVGVIFVTRRLTNIAVTNLVTREVTGELLAKVRGTVRRHEWGVYVSIVSSLVVILIAFLDGFSIFGETDLGDILEGLALLLDMGGDVAGILLLSGIGVLLRREDPEAGDINGHIRGLLHSAVLTGRADIVFEGRVFPSAGNHCIVSFPGKFVPEWHTLTWAAEQGEQSCACVFLPTSDPMERFGRHTSPSDCVDPERCWCHLLYGNVKPWGCQWFAKWKANVEKAVELDQELVVVFFPGQAGKGTIDWDDLGHSDLWNGVGLGGSQKAEVAYLRSQGLSFVEEDLDAFRLRMFRQRCSSASYRRFVS